MSERKVVNSKMVDCFVVTRSTRSNVFQKTVMCTTLNKEQATEMVYRGNDAKAFFWEYEVMPLVINLDLI